MGFAKERTLLQGEMGRYELCCFIVDLRNGTLAFPCGVMEWK